MRLNPVLEREVRERPRTAGAVVMLTFYLVLVTGVFVIVYQAERYSSGRGQVLATAVARVGQQQFEWTLCAMLLLVLFLVPGYTASSVTGERERQTLLPMQLTLLRPARIASGKASAAVAFLGLLVAATTPLLALSFVMGGVTLLQIVRGLAAVLFVGVVLAMVSVACSTLVRRTASATVLAYTAVLAVTIGTMALWGGLTAVRSASNEVQGTHFAPGILATANPLMFVAAAIDPSDPDRPLEIDDPARAPFTGIQIAMHDLEAETVNQSGTRIAPGGSGLIVVGSGPITPPSGLGPQQQVRFTQPGPFRHFLWWSLATQLALAAAAWWLAARRLRLPTNVER
jgi:ABC-type transport system involved in multi-copper enzyme maturation permease subunit